ncbi:hypothetical protein Pelo_15003 [Pelomyxa schiedti]|nr:hypothetical protein Pelo_15003 [Pelomyxa schiedti]
MDNPDSIIGWGGFYGLGLFAESKTVVLLAAICQVINYLFIVFVESPHMRKIHGGKLRPISGIQSGVTDIFLDMVEKNPRIQKLNKKARREISKIKKRITTEIKGLSIHDRIGLQKAKSTLFENLLLKKKKS